ncbi:MAG: restriction endonuclease subunit S, partial [Anaerolineae bacterium]
MKVPEGWAEARLGELVHIRSGYAPSAAQSGGTGEIGYVRVDDLNASPKYISVGRDRATAPRNGIVPSGSVMFPKRGAAISTNKVRIAACDLLMDTNMMALTVRPHRLDAEFLYYLLVHEKLYRIADTSTIPQINNKHIEPYRVALPPVAEQRKIAEILGAWDEAIALVERRLAAARARKQGLAQRLLIGQVRFPGFTEPWREVRLGEVVEINAHTLGNSTNPEDKFRYFDLSAVDHGRVALPQEMIRFDQLPSRARRKLRKFDVLIATVRPLLQAFALCDFDVTDLLCSTGFAVISADTETDARLIYQCLYSEPLLRQMGAAVAGSNYPAMGAADVAAMKPHWPSSKAERARLVEFLDSVDVEIDALDTKLA